ncbi:MAG: DUF3179 domain-containing protein [Phycisphaerales bacterium]|jgi:hypothetical protein|nr:DUF3179 domain-containing protein [Phycisphaerales bacterium]
MVLPLLVIGLDLFFAAIMAYGTHPNLAQFSHGLDLILITRRFQWLLVAISMLLAILLIVMVVSGKRRAWWLIGLAPILALFFHRFSNESINALGIIDNPTFIAAEQTHLIRDEDEVVGLIFADVPYAYPYAVLFSNPVVIQTDHDRRMILFWSAFANRAQAFEITRELKARDLEIVSMPANALLLYNSRLGQFINGLTGLTQPLGRKLGDKPAGVRDPIRTWKMPWSTWRTRYPQTRVLQPVRTPANAPAAPVLPHYKLPREPGDTSTNLRIIQIETTPPVALPENALGGSPLNLTAAGQTVLLYRDPRTSAPRAFDRRIEQDLYLRFIPNTDPRRPKAFLIDTATNTAWNADGTALDGTRRGNKLAPIAADESLYWPVMKYWYPDLSIYTPQPSDMVSTKK